jgi:hypothetical protein
VVTVHRVDNGKIAVYGRDHGPPHFQIEGPGFRGSVSIQTFQLIIGTVPPAVHRPGLLERALA